MNGEPVRIAQVIGKLSAGGVESVVYNYYRHMDRTQNFSLIFLLTPTQPARRGKN